MTGAVRRRRTIDQKRHAHHSCVQVGYRGMLFCFSSFRRFTGLTNLNVLPCHSRLFLRHCGGGDCCCYIDCGRTTITQRFRDSTLKAMRYEPVAVPENCSTEYCHCGSPVSRRDRERGQNVQEENARKVIRSTSEVFGVLGRRPEGRCVFRSAPLNQVLVKVRGWEKKTRINCLPL